jgi:hypothetical protein
MLWDVVGRILHSLPLVVGSKEGSGSYPQTYLDSLASSRQDVLITGTGTTLPMVRRRNGRGTESVPVSGKELPEERWSYSFVLFKFRNRMRVPTTAIEALW